MGTNPIDGHICHKWFVDLVFFTAWKYLSGIFRNDIPFGLRDFFQECYACGLKWLMTCTNGGEPNGEQNSIKMANILWTVETHCIFISLIDHDKRFNIVNETPGVNQSKNKTFTILFIFTIYIQIWKYTKWPNKEMMLLCPLFPLECSHSKVTLILNGVSLTINHVTDIWRQHGALNKSKWLYWNDLYPKQNANWFMIAHKMISRRY